MDLGPNDLYKQFLNLGMAFAERCHRIITEGADDELALRAGGLILAYLQWSEARPPGESLFDLFVKGGVPIATQDDIDGLLAQLEGDDDEKEEAEVLADD